MVCFEVVSLEIIVFLIPLISTFLDSLLEYAFKMSVFLFCSSESFVCMNFFGDESWLRISLFMISALIIRPLGPEPLTLLKSIFLSLAILLANGVEKNGFCVLYAVYPSYQYYFLLL